MDIGILNGPNLGRLGKREPDVYGAATLHDLREKLDAEAKQLGLALAHFQSNHEGELIDRIEAWTYAGCRGLIINLGALTHTSIALRDAIAGSALPAVEVHLSHVYAREDFRHRSLSAPVCLGMITGLGFEGYLAALRFLRERLGN